MSRTGEAPRALLARLESVLGSASEARDRVAGALLVAGLSALPEEPESLMEFVHDHLIGTLESLCGERIATVFVEELESEILPQSNVRERTRDELIGMEKKRVGLVDDDPFRRSSVARALIHAGLDVLVLDPEQIHNSDVDALVSLGNAADCSTLRNSSKPVIVAQPTALVGEVVARSTAPRDIADAVLSVFRRR